MTTKYPFGIDDDSTIFRVDDNLSELGTDVINQLRSAVFAIEKELGITPSGSLSSLRNFLDVSFNQNGTLKTSALTSVGLATLPIVDNQVGNNAAIKEFKLALDFSTANLNTQIQANSTLIGSLSSFTNTINNDLLLHISGGQFLTDGVTLARHVASQLDLNAVPSDVRDPAFIWSGLLDQNGNLRSATTVATALLQINNDLIDHLNAIVDAHPATAITLDTSNFTEIPADADTVQKGFDAIDNLERINLGLHRAVQHANGVPKASRSETCFSDGYTETIIPVTPVTTYLYNTGFSPTDNGTTGDDIVKFNPTNNSGFFFDSQFKNVRPGDVVRINYGDGIEYVTLVDSIRYDPGTDFTIRLASNNLRDGYDGYARIDRPKFDPETFGVLAVGQANNDINTNILSSIVVGNPRGAAILGLGFSPDKLDADHYNLWIQFYPTGDPNERSIDLPAIDVTGNQGATPNAYTLQSVVKSTNDGLRAAGFNYRLIAFEQNGEFGLMVADDATCASFAVISGSISGGVLVPGSFTQNVVGDASDGIDPLGLGLNLANFAGPPFQTSFSSAADAQFATKVILPRKNRNYYVNGVRTDTFASTYLANQDGYWDGYIDTVTVVGSITVEVTYRIFLDLQQAELKPGKTLVVQPAVDFTDPRYTDSDYGRFIIKDVTVDCLCPPTQEATLITVINGIHASGSPITPVPVVGVPVRIYFGQDSVAFNSENVDDAAPSGIEYFRFHEIYVDDTGNTFSHERARFANQTAETSELVVTSNFRLTNVAPKLRGYIVDGSIQPDRFLRVYILSYDTFTGEFDGYVGQRDAASPNIFRTGPITTARKNVPTRFYDETQVDFIELEFREPAASPGTDVLVSGQPRYFDLQLFPSLQTNDELFYIASCEVRGNIVEDVRDRRDFGTISEKEFTTSAINFISAGDRALHANGVVRGFDFQGLDPNNTDRIFFNGGVALVNGKIVTANNISVVIPELKAQSSVLPQVYQWAVCINEFGQPESVLLTNTKQQFFAELSTGGPGYYVQSVTFPELVNTRKDLTLIYIVTVTISSLAIDDIADARRFIFNESLNIPFTWVADEDIVGHFQTLEQVEVWVNNFGSLNNTIKLRGRFNFSETIDLSTFTNPVTFEGENAIFNFENVNRGIILGSNQTFRNIKFDYLPSNTVVNPSDTIQNGNGCFFKQIGGAETVSNILIENCVFESPEVNRRPPFINIFMDVNAVLDNFVVRDCRFIDNEFVDSRFAAAIAIINQNSAGSNVPAIAANVKIENNICNFEQGIYITSVPQSGIITSPGIATYNTRIINNDCGVIGYLVSSTPDLDQDFSGDVRQRELLIQSNNCLYIANINSQGATVPYAFFTVILIQHSTGNVRILDNHVSWIQVNYITSNTSPGLLSTLLICNNTLTAYDETGYLALNFNSTNEAIRVFGPSDSSTVGSVIITDNTIQSGQFGGTEYFYAIGILNQVKATIKDNSISGFVSNTSNDGYGIFSSFSQDALIQGNSIYRGNLVINGYVGSSPTGGGFVVDNFFDGYETGALPVDIEVVKVAQENNWFVERNKNQRKIVQLSGTEATHGIDVNLFGPSASVLTNLSGLGGPEIRVSPVANNGSARLEYQLIGGVIEFASFFPLNTILPQGAVLINISATVRILNNNAAAPPPTTANLIIVLSSDDQANALTTFNLLPFFNNVAPLTATVLGANEFADPSSYVNNQEQKPTITFIGELDAPSNPPDFYTVTFDNIQLVYTY